MSSPNKNIPLCKIGRMGLLCLVCAVFVLSIMLTACGSGSDDEDSSSGGDTIVLDWENDQIIVEVTSGGDAEDILTTPVRSLNNSDTPPTDWTLTQIGIDVDGDGIPDEVSAYEYDSGGYLERKLTYLDVDANGDPVSVGNPDEIVEYNVDDGVLDYIEYDTDGDGTPERKVNYGYDGEGRIDEEETDSNPVEIWDYDYDTDEGAFLKERYIGDADDANEIVVYNEYGDIVKISANPDSSGVFQSIIEITPTYNNFGNIAATTTIFDIGGTQDTEVVTYSYTWDDTSGNLISYEADDGDNSTIDPVTIFTWVQN